MKVELDLGRLAAAGLARVRCTEPKDPYGGGPCGRDMQADAVGMWRCLAGHGCYFPTAVVKVRSG